MLPLIEFEAVHRLIAAGLNDCEIGRRTGIPVRTICRWRGQSVSARLRRADPDCPRCSSTILPGPAYAYLLGLYLGDGCLTTLPKGLYRLEITLDARYAMVIFEAALAMSGMRPSAWRPVGQRPRPGCVVLSSVWKHWPCLFPQHGPGRKHERKIEFATWQQSIINRHPEYLLRGLLQSDGSRFLNRVKRQAYARYQFTNLSDDIREIFCRACDDFGVAWRTMNAKSISIARRADVVRLDTVVGPKR